MVEERVIEIKKNKLKKELSKENPDKKIIRRLEDSIKRHKKIALHRRHRRIKNKRKWKS